MPTSEVERSRGEVGTDTQTTILSRGVRAGLIKKVTSV